MIGVNIRGVRHLFRVCNSVTLKNVLIKRCEGGECEICQCIKTPEASFLGEQLIIFNPWASSSRSLYNDLKTISPEFSEEIDKAQWPKIAKMNKTDTFLSFSFSEIVLLPDSFNEDYASFLKTNGKMVNELFSKYEFSSDSIVSKMLYIYTNGSKNFFQWAAKLYFKIGISFATINNILTWHEHYGYLAKNLSKKSITAYTNEFDFYKLLEELSSIRKCKRINDVINSFNTNQKKLLKNNTLTDKDKETLSRFFKLSDTKKENFIKKVSTIDDFQEIMRQMRHLTNIHFDWNKESFMDYINNVDNINCQIIKEGEDFIILKVNDYETIKQLAKTTNWCISKNKTYWNNYIPSFGPKISEQYVIFDFSKLEDDKFSIVGFTTTKNEGITSAHNFINDNIIGNNYRVHHYLTSYLDNVNKGTKISSILDKYGITPKMIVKYDMPAYEWSYDGFLGYLYQFVEKDNVTELHNHDGKVVLFVQDDGINELIPENRMTYDMMADYFVIFLDFTKEIYDQDKYFIAFIKKNELEGDTCICLINALLRESNIGFNDLLYNFDMPYNCINRPNNIDNRLVDYIFSYNVNAIKRCLKEDSNCLDKVLKTKVRSNELFSVIGNSLNEYYSFDMVDLIYGSTHILSDYLKPNDMNNLIQLLVSSLKAVRRALNNDMLPNTNIVFEKPTQENIDALCDGKITNSLEIKFLSLYLFIRNIITHEVGSTIKYDKIYDKTIEFIERYKLQGSLIDEIILLMASNISKQSNISNTQEIYRIVEYITEYGDSNAKEMLETIATESQLFRTAYKELPKEMTKGNLDNSISISLDLIYDMVSSSTS